MINIRKLAAVDMVFLGSKVIIAEYACGMLLPFILGVLSIRSGFKGPSIVGWELAMGVWLISIAANYIPLFVYSVLIARAGTVKEEGQPELARAKRYGTQQVIIRVPFLVVVIALIQEQGRRKA